MTSFETGHGRSGSQKSLCRIEAGVVSTVNKKTDAGAGDNISDPLLSDGFAILIPRLFSFAKRFLAASNIFL
jgi:hypothetical protein